LISIKNQSKKRLIVLFIVFVKNYFANSAGGKNAPGAAPG